MKTRVNPAYRRARRASHPNRIRFSALAASLACLTWLPLSSQAIIDLDTDTLDDVWEAFFGAQGVAAGNDEDGDGKTNLEECLAGTNPFDASDCLAITSSTVDTSNATVTFDTVNGKRYRVQVGSSLAGGSYANHGNPVDGTGSPVTIGLSSSGDAAVTGSATHEVWTGISGTDVANLTGNADYPASPDGTEALSGLQTASNIDDNYGGRILGFIKPPATGNYTFYIASRHGSEFWLSTDATPGNKVKRASVTSDLVGPEDWTHSGEQSSAAIGLNAGQKYYFEVLHKHGTQADHCAVGWQGPGLPAGIQVVDGEFLCPIVGSSGPAPISGPRAFIRVAVQDLDQDGDGLSDYAEKLMSGEGNFSPFDSNSTTSGSDDFTTVSNAIGASGETVSVITTDSQAIEDNRNGAQVTGGTPIANVAPDLGRFRVQRSGTLQQLTVSVSLAGAPAEGDVDGAEANDYSATDSGGATVTGSVSLGFGQVSAQIVIDPVDDSGGAAPHEFPETVRCTVLDTASYDLGAQAFADVVIYDARDIPEQQTLFVAASEPEPGSVAAQGSAVVAGKLNGFKNHMVLNTIINSGFSSPQDDSHIHKANPGPTPGSIVYEITNIPGVSISDPLLGEIGPDYPYPIEESAGYDACQIVDSFFNQNGETPMYLNWHTVNNGSGELWALFSVATGSIDPPVHPPMPAHTFLTGDALKKDIYRFLNQATFGATEEDVQAIKTAIETERLTNPAYSRIEEFEDWIDDQIALEQTYLLDYLLALNLQEWINRDYYDPSIWYTQAEFPGNPALPPTHASQTWVVQAIPPIAPGINPNPLMMPRPEDIGHLWPSIDRSPGTTGGNPFEWRATDDFPLSRTHRGWGDDNDNSGPAATLPRQAHNGTNYTNSYNKWAMRDVGNPAERNKYMVHWMMHVNAHDQLRQKMGFALQQICVVANTLTVIEDRDLGMANYQDQLNRMAFGKYRDIIDWIMVSPQMGWWLSSFNNQKAADISVPPDGTIDVFPDENLAREVMQLFTCGLFMMHADGSLALNADSGLPQATYDNDDITELSRVITGHGYGKHITNNGGTTEHTFWEAPANNTGNGSFARTAGDSRVEHTFNYPMKMFGKYHDILPKTILGGKVINNSALANGTGSSSANDTDASWNDETNVGNLDMKDALDWLSGIPGDGQPDFDQVHSHQSTAPFIARRLIQRFVTSNPSGAYLERVAKAFRDGYGAQGGEGDLLSACKAMLLDWEARDPAAATDTMGLKKSPYEAYVQLLRAFDAHSQIPLKPYDGSEPAGYTGVGNYDPGSNPDLYLQNLGYPASQLDNFRLNTQFRYSNTDATLTMSPMYQQTVFNFYLPEYSPGGVISQSSLVSPEMMIANATSIYQNINYFYTLCLSTSANNSGESELDFNRPDDAFQVASGATNNERIRIDTDKIADGGDGPGGTPGLYPETGTELERDTAFFDELDRRLTGGVFKAKYPWDPSDDNVDPDPLDPEVGPPGPNPREAIIIFMRDTYSHTSSTGIRDKLRYGLYLLTTSPDYLVRQ